MTTTKSVKASATAFIEGLGETVITPFDIVSAMEEAFMSRPMFTPVHRQTTREHLIECTRIKHTPKTRATILRAMTLGSPELRAEIRLGARLHHMLENEDVINSLQAKLKPLHVEAGLMQHDALLAQFGKYLPDDEKRIVNNAKKGLKSVESRVAASFYACDKIKSRKLWKLEQKRNEAASHHGERVKAGKTVVDGKAVWDDAQVHELPPLGENAYYAIKLPDGRVVSLAKSVDGFAAKLNKYPSQALQNIASRLGIEMRGGDTAILNHLLGAEPIITKTTILDEDGEEMEQIETNWKWLPSYTSVWQGVWIVYVGWRLNPKMANSSYWEDDNGELTQFNPNYQMTPDDEGYQAPLTLSELDYSLLSESSDLAVENEDGEVVEFMNEEEEFLTAFPQRESDETFIDFSKYCDDDAEMELFQACSGVIERSEGGITLGDLESSQFIDGYIHKGILRTERTLRQMKDVEDPDAKLLAIIDGMEKHLARLNRLDAEWNAFVGTRHNEPMPAKATFGAKGDFREPSKVLPCMTEEPLNLIEAPSAREVDVMPEHAVVTYSWLDALSPKLMAKREREARKGQVLRAVADGTLKAQLAFASAFEGALRA